LTEGRKWLPKGKKNTQVIFPHVLCSSPLVITLTVRGVGY